MKKTYKPGEIGQASGQAEIIGPRGAKTGLEITIVKGKTIPPSRRPGMTFRLRDLTKHRRPKA